MIDNKFDNINHHFDFYGLYSCSDLPGNLGYQKAIYAS